MTRYSICAVVFAAKRGMPKQSTFAKFICRLKGLFQSSDTEKLDGNGTDFGPGLSIHLSGPQGTFDKQLFANAVECRDPVNWIKSLEIEGPEIAPIQRVGFSMPSQPNKERWRWNCTSVRVQNCHTSAIVFIDGTWIDKVGRIFWKPVLTELELEALRAETAHIDPR